MDQEIAQEQLCGIRRVFKMFYHSLFCGCTELVVQAHLLKI